MSDEQASVRVTSRTSAEVRDLLAGGLDSEVGLESEVGLDELADPHTFDVAPGSWVVALRLLRDDGLDYLDWLSAVDLGGDAGFQVVAHLARVGVPGEVEHWLVRTTLPAEAPALPTATGVFRGAGWHERETHEMFGIDFVGHPHLVPLLLPDGFEGHPLRKDFVLAARVAKAWPGAKEPGESGEGTPSRRRVQPPGLPDESWGPRTPVPNPDDGPDDDPDDGPDDGPSESSDVPADEGPDDGQGGGPDGGPTAPGVASL